MTHRRKKRPPGSASKARYLTIALVVMVFLDMVVFKGWDWTGASSYKRQSTLVPIPAEQPLKSPPLSTQRSLLPPPKPPKPQQVWKKNAQPVTLLPGHRYIAVVIDDMGVDARRSSEMIMVSVPLTLAFLAYGAASQGLAEKAHANGHEIMVHVPMEPLSKTENPGENVLYTTMSEAELRATLDKNLEKFPMATGLNNHMGSGFTQNRDSVSKIMPIIQDKGMLFLDSKTIGNSVALEAADAMDIPAIERDVFLDHDPDYTGVTHSLADAERVAAKRGYAVVIGHPKDATTQALKNWLPGLAGKKIQIVPLSALVSVRLAAKASQPPQQPVQ